MGEILSTGWLRVDAENGVGGIVIRVAVEGITKEIIFGNHAARFSRAEWVFVLLTPLAVSLRLKGERPVSP